MFFFQRSVPESCYPFEDYNGYDTPGRKSGMCRVPRAHHFNVAKVLQDCAPLLNRRDLFKTQPAYKVGRRNTAKHPNRKELDIMYEIMTHGPVQGKHY